MRSPSACISKLFLSTPSARRATSLQREIDTLTEISIHALREEGDRNTCTYIHLVAEFLSTPSARRATLSSIVKLPPHIISIHALREEGDIQSNL